MTTARYHKGSAEDAVKAAKRLKADRDLFVYPAGAGMTIAGQAPPFRLQHYAVKPDGSHERVEYTYY